eukprot:CAMPEP_0167761170 /NCGR_PEP_ID=MMETSP0110_2-20121227/12015_1 /TAXON_ID=629695 /ORGANISM="Gymnochlora sp., Strain CCMP2014" /LENGTH=142 /DNA_ID=CAMNT_0007647807 /DNA_START=1 /DNA_END=426 /DNA_ORIENTATION=-
MGASQAKPAERKRIEAEEKLGPIVTSKYPPSSTEAYLLENDFLLETVLKRTQTNFVDALQRLVMLDEKETVDRAQKYSKMEAEISYNHPESLPTAYTSDIKRITQDLSMEVQLDTKMFAAFVDVEAKMRAHRISDDKIIQHN